MTEPGGFLDVVSERADLNQYWFSRGTIDALVAEAVDAGGAAAFVSTPSVYFSLPLDARQSSKVLDFDRQWQDDPGFVFYDFNHPDAIPGELHGTFDFVLVDPPFITRDVWEKYAATCSLLLRPSGRLLCTTTAENAAMMGELLRVAPVAFRPSIPNLVYQYCVYTNYPSARLEELNHEIDQEHWQADILERQAAVAGVVGEAPIRVSAAASCLDPDALVAAALAASVAGGVDATAPGDAAEPLSPGAATASALRSRILRVKRALEAVRTRLLQPLAAGGSGRASIGKNGDDVALLALEEATESALRWHGELLPGALEEAAGPSAAALAPEDGCWGFALAASLAARARTALAPDAATSSLVLVPDRKSLAAEVGDLAQLCARCGGVLLDRVKELKRAT